MNDQTSRVEVLADTPLTDESCTIHHHNGVFTLYALDEFSMARAPKARWLAEWAFERGALEVRFDYDLCLDGP